MHVFELPVSSPMHLKSIVMNNSVLSINRIDQFYLKFNVNTSQYLCFHSLGVVFHVPWGLHEISTTA